MTDSTTTQPATTNAPSYIAYSVRDRVGAKGTFTRIGAAWPHKDGKGFSIQIEAQPLDGRIVIRVPSDKKDNA